MTDPVLPLSGITVVDLTAHVAGPACTALLADYGADVIKVEPLSGDPRRRSVTRYDGMSISFFETNRNKRSIAIDAKTSTGRDIIRRLIESADVFVENFRPGVCDGLGLSYETVSGWNADILYCSISGFNASGPNAQRRAFDLVVQAISGAMSVTGPLDGEVVPAGFPIADCMTGVFGALAVTTALVAPKGERGRHLEVTMASGMMWLLGFRFQEFFATGTVPGPRGSLLPMTAYPWQVFEAKDKPFVVCAAQNDLFKRLCECLGREDLRDDPRFESSELRVANREILGASLQQMFLERTRDEWLQLLLNDGVAVAPVNSVKDVMESDLAESEGSFVEVERNGRSLRVQRAPIRIDGQRGRVVRAAPELSADVREILTDFGYAESEIIALSEKGIIGLPDDGCEQIG